MTEEKLLKQFYANEKIVASEQSKCIKKIEKIVLSDKEVGQKIASIIICLLNMWVGFTIKAKSPDKRKNKQS